MQVAGGEDVVEVDLEEVASRELSELCDVPWVYGLAWYHAVMRSGRHLHVAVYLKKIRTKRLLRLLEFVDYLVRRCEKPLEDEAIKAVGRSFGIRIRSRDKWSDMDRFEASDYELLKETLDVIKEIRRSRCKGD